MTARAFSIPVPGAVLSGEQSGENPALALLHGFGGSRAGWDRVVAHLPTDLPLLRYDLRGFGASTMDDDTPEYSHADDLLALLDRLDIAKIAVCGLSLGGGVALNFALDHPDRVSKLVLICPMLIGWAWSTEWIDHWREIAGAARSGDMARARTLWAEHPLFASVRDSDAADEHHAAIEAFSGRQWLRDPQRRSPPDADRLGMLAVPTLLLSGERDLPDFRQIADTLTAGAPDIRRVDIAQAGHLLPLETPDAVARYIANFLTQ